MKQNSWLVSVLAAVLYIALFTGCGGTPTTAPSAAPPASTGQRAKSAPVSVPAATSAPAQNVTLNVVSTYADHDGNAHNFRKAVADWSALTGNQVSNNSGTALETFKAGVLASFENGTEPDVLFYFNGVDANPFIAADQVVSIAEIRQKYPDYAANMKDGMLGASPVDGKHYSVPVNGYWEGLFCNRAVLAACGVAVPGADYTWDQFLKDCAVIRAAGYTPVACSLATVPHYWFEYCIYRHLTPATHGILPAPARNGEIDPNNVQYKAWLSGLGDIKAMYEAGCFPENTLTATDDETFDLFLAGEAAFLLDGSWKVGSIETACGADAENNIHPDAQRLENFTVTYVPGQSARQTTDIIGGLSSGYFITRKAWDDPDKRAAAVQFVSYMTSDEMVSRFAQATGNLTTALIDGAEVDERKLSSLAIAGLNLTQGAAGIASAVQDQIPMDCRAPVFDRMGDIVSGRVPIAEAVQACLALMAEGLRFP